MKKVHIFVRLFAALLCLTLLFVSCNKPEDPQDPDWNDELSIEVRGDSYPLTVRDYLKHETVLTEKPQRVAVLSGTPLNVWYDLGGKSVCAPTISANLKVVSEYEQEIRALPDVGKVTAVNMEAVVSYQPDLIIAQESSQGQLIQSLREMGYKVITTKLRDYDDVVDAYRAFGKILQVSDLAEQKVTALHARYTEITAKAPARGKKIVILYLTSKSVQVKLESSIAGVVADALKLQNMAAGLSPVEEGSENTPLDLEYLVANQPDMILVTSMIASNDKAVATMEKNFAENPAWQGVNAVQEGRVAYLPQEYFLYNAGPYFDEAVRYMACSVYPEIYGNVNEWYGK